MDQERKIMANLAKNLLSLRKQRGLTQADLAKVTAVPRSTIAHMESGEANPSVLVLGKLATGFQVSLEELLVKPRGDYKFIAAKDVPVVERSGGKAVLFKLLPDHLRGMEIDRLELKPGSRMKGVPHLAHTKEYLTCIKGRIDLYSAGQKFSLSVGDVLAFPGDQAHSYHNPSRELAVCLSVVALAF